MAGAGGKCCRGPRNARARSAREKVSLPSWVSKARVVWQRSAAGWPLSCWSARGLGLGPGPLLRRSAPWRRGVAAAVPGRSCSPDAFAPWPASRRTSPVRRGAAVNSPSKLSRSQKAVRARELEPAGSAWRALAWAAPSLGRVRPSLARGLFGISRLEGTGGRDSRQLGGSGGGETGTCASFLASLPRKSPREKA